MHRALDPEIPDMGERGFADDFAHPPRQGARAGVERDRGGLEAKPLTEMVARPAIKSLAERVGMGQVIGDDVGAL